MELSATGRNGPVWRLPGEHAVWLLALAALLAWNGWLTLGLFGPDRPLERLVDDQPILSGRHPLHLYHGALGARALQERGTLSCYDPAFHAGYPKTPVFDSGSRPAELILALAGGRYCPAAYKVGHALMWAVVPWLLFTAARGVGLSRGAACLACVLGLLVWWGQPCREALRAGDVDLLLATLLVLAQAGLLIRYHHAPGVVSLLGVVLANLCGWFAHPVLLALLLPLFLVYYLSVGTRHRLAWHLFLLGGLLAALGANAFWLVDWVDYWWIRTPLHSEAPLLVHRTFRTLWEAPVWGGPVDRALACGLILTAAAGVLLYHETSQRATARLLGLGWAGFLLLALAGLVWEPLGRLGAARLLVPALLFAALPAAHALTELLHRAGRPGPARWTLLGAAAGLLALTALTAGESLGGWAARLLAPEPLPIGLGPEREAVVAALRAHTTDEARILWEDRRGSPGQSRWTALLPLLTGRSYVGGLDPDAGIDHTAGGLVEETLAGRPLRDWSDGELQEYCTRYNIGWVVCWTAGACRRFRGWTEAEPLMPLPPEEEAAQGGWLFRLRRQPSYALTGSAVWRSADSRRIELGDVVPRPHAEDGEGEVVLSLHYQAGMRVAPSRVRLEPTVETSEPVPFVRLRLAEPAARLSITWDKR